VKGEGVVATLYDSGKLVVQGSEPERFLVRFTDEPAPAPPRPLRPLTKTVTATEPIVGSDEAGKGDWFGPLVVAAVRIDIEEAGEIAEFGVADSKSLSDTRVLRLAALLRDRVSHSVVRIDPPEYNRRYPTYPGLNEFLTDLHVEAIREVGKDEDRVIVDQFAWGNPVQMGLSDTKLRVEERPRAEEELAVAAASVLARAEFLLAIMELSERNGMELFKGAGPLTDRAGARFVIEHGEAKLAQVAKLHFKNTLKVQERVRRSG
jgi:ribonuclease HIII